MSDLNNYSFTGRLGAPAETKYATSGTAIWSARVAVGYGYGDKKGTNWITAKMFGKRAEGLAKLDLEKGTHVAVTGELQVREYDRKDGTKGTSIEVNATDVHLIGSKPDGARSESRPAQRQAPAQQADASFGDRATGGFEDSEIPFAPIPRRQLW